MKILFGEPRWLFYKANDPVGYGLVSGKFTDTHPRGAQTWSEFDLSALSFRQGNDTSKFCDIDQLYCWESVSPTVSPTNPTVSPSFSPSTSPSHGPSTVPSVLPTTVPSTVPTIFPTNVPSVRPTYTPTRVPTIRPTDYPSRVPTLGTSICIFTAIEKFTTPIKKINTFFIG